MLHIPWNLFIFLSKSGSPSKLSSHPKQIVPLYTGVALSKYMVKVKEKYFKTKYRPAGMLLDVNAVICFKFRLQLNFRSNKKYFSIIVSFYTGSCQKKST